jgi:hypothetical protein
LFAQQKHLKNRSSIIIHTVELEPKRLLKKKKYRAAVISSFVLLESELREIAQFKISEKHLFPLSKIIDALLIKRSLIKKILIY